MGPMLPHVQLQGRERARETYQEQKQMGRTLRVGHVEGARKKRGIPGQEFIGLGRPGL